MRRGGLIIALCLLAVGCADQSTPTYAGRRHSRIAPQEPAVDSQPAASPALAVAFFLNALAANDADAGESAVLIPDDESRANWVRHQARSGAGQHTPFTIKDTTIQGTAAVVHVAFDPPAGNGTVSPFISVRRDGGWLVVIDYFERGGLDSAESDVVRRELKSMGS